MADVFQKIKGTTPDITRFLIGGPDADGVENSDSVIKSVDKDGTLIRHRAATLATGGANDDNTLIPLRDLKDFCPEIEFGFAGGSAPSPGDNTGEYGICMATGGSYTVGNIVYDSGSALRIVPTEVIRKLTIGSTTIPMSDGTTFLANHFYVKNAAGTWVAKGDGHTTGSKLTIKIPFDYEDTAVSSTMEISGYTDAQVTETVVVVTTAFNGSSPTIAVSLNSNTTVMGTSAVDLTTVGQYRSNEIFDVIADDDEGTVNLAITPSTSSAGAGYVLLTFVDPSA